MENMYPAMRRGRNRNINELGKSESTKRGLWEKAKTDKEKTKALILYVTVLIQIWHRTSTGSEQESHSKIKHSHPCTLLVAATSKQASPTTQKLF